MKGCLQGKSAATDTRHSPSTDLTKSVVNADKLFKTVFNIVLDAAVSILLLKVYLPRSYQSSFEGLKYLFLVYLWSISRPPLGTQNVLESVA